VRVPTSRLLFSRRGDDCSTLFLSSVAGKAVGLWRHAAPPPCLLARGEVFVQGKNGL